MKFESDSNGPATHYDFDNSNNRIRYEVNEQTAVCCMKEVLHYQYCCVSRSVEKWRRGGKLFRDSRNSISSPTLDTSISLSEKQPSHCQRNLCSAARGNFIGTTTILKTRKTCKKLFELCPK